MQPMEVSTDQSATTDALKGAAETQLTPDTVEGYIGGLRSFDGNQDVQTNVMSAFETTNDESAAETIDEDSRWYDYYTRGLLDRDKYITGRKKELDQLESFGVIRGIKKSEATDGTHVRMKIIAHNKSDLVRWRLVSMEVNQHERHDVFAGTPALKVFRMLIGKNRQVNVTQNTVIAKSLQSLMSQLHSFTQTWKTRYTHIHHQKLSQIGLSCGC